MFEDLKNVSGIYCFENKQNAMKYIGKSVDLRKRILDHLNNLRKNLDECSYLQNAWNVYGEKCFSIFIIEECSVEEISDKEIFYIKEYKTKRPDGYNLTNGGDGSTGYIHSEETKNKLSQIRKEKFSGANHPRYGVSLSDKTKDKIKKSLIGKKLSKETKDKLSESRKGEKHYLFGRKRNKSSEYLGVYLKKEKWKVRIKVNGKSIHVGTYCSEVEAAIGYNEYVIKNNLPNKLNIIE